MFNYIMEAINEETARRAKENISFSDYKPGTATKEYTDHMDALVEIAEDYARKSKYITEEPERINEAQSYINYYGRKFAEYINNDNAITCRCPSVMIAGPANFPVRKTSRTVAPTIPHHAAHHRLGPRLIAPRSHYLWVKKYGWKRIRNNGQSMRYLELLYRFFLLFLP